MGNGDITPRTMTVSPLLGFAGHGVQGSAGGSQVSVLLPAEPSQGELLQLLPPALVPGPGASFLTPKNHLLMGFSVSFLFCSCCLLLLRQTYNRSEQKSPGGSGARTGEKKPPAHKYIKKEV